MIENPNPDVMATGVRVVTRLLDDAGTELLVDSALLNAILPEQRMAVGRTLDRAHRGPDAARGRDRGERVVGARLDRRDASPPRTSSPSRRKRAAR